MRFYISRTDQFWINTLSVIPSLLGSGSVCLCHGYQKKNSTDSRETSRSCTHFFTQHSFSFFSNFTKFLFFFGFKIISRSFSIYHDQFYHSYKRPVEIKGKKILAQFGLWKPKTQHRVQTIGMKFSLELDHAISFLTMYVIVYGDTCIENCRSLMGNI